MGFRKASAAPSDQENEAAKGEVADQNLWSKGDKSGYIAKEVLGSKSSLSRKRKSSTLASKSKRLRIEDEDVIGLKLTWEEAQGLLRPPPNLVPSILMIDGFEFEENEDAPVLGKPTLFTTNNRGDKIQWVQCEECMKWRKLGAECLLPSRWTCAENSWDLERSSCSAAQELTPEQIEDVVSYTIGTRTNQKIEWSGGLKKKSKKTGSKKEEEEELERGLEGLDALAHMAIIGEGGCCEQQVATTTKHPRHRPGCTCIVCIQPPSGKGPKHKQTCTCNVCVTVKRRFRTLMLRREKKQEVETATKKQSLPTILQCGATNNTTNSPSPSHVRRRRKRQVGKNECSSNSENDDDEEENKLLKGFKCGIDLNIQPEREEELSPASDPSKKTLVRVHQEEEEEEEEQQAQTAPPIVLLPLPPPSRSSENQDLSSTEMAAAEEEEEAEPDTKPIT